MKKSTFYCIMLCFSGVLQAQHDSFPAILRVFPEKGGAYAPVFSTFCSDRCWLSEREFDLTSMRFVPRDSTSCVPIFTKRIWHGSDPADLDPTTLQWQADEYDFNYLWTYEYRSDQLAPGGGKDTLILWRYDRQKARQDSFASLLQGEITIGKPGIWVTDHKEMVLLDRRSGQVLSRAENPDGLGVMMRLQAWGDDVIVNDRWLYQRIHARYVPFFPLPADMEGCNSPQKLEFQGELCLSSIREEGNLYAYYLVAPGHPPIKMPFEPNNFSYQGYLLAANPPLAWLCEKDTLRSFDFTMGGTSAYPGSTIEPLHGNHDGRFLGFYSELGLSFFDKYNCQFRVLQLPYGHKMPRNFTANHQYIFLTYENHWDIVNFSKLETAFRRSPISNTSRNSQTLDTIFLRRWHESLSLTLHPIRDKSCEDIWGEFPLIREKTPVEVQAVTLLPGSSYIETFVLGHSTMKKNYDASKFNLAIDTIYSYHMEYHHPTLQWLWMSAPGGRFSVE